MHHRARRANITPANDASRTRSYLADESDLNILIKSVRFLLHLARTEPLSDVLDLRSTTTKDSLFWPGDADPDKVCPHALGVAIQLTST